MELADDGRDWSAGNFLANWGRGGKKMMAVHEEEEGLASDFRMGNDEG